MSTKSLSVVIPAHNEEKNIRNSIASVLSIVPKYCKNFEIIVINDKSRDKTGQIINQLAKVSKNIRAYHNKQNLGFGGTYWKGVNLAKFEYCMMVWGDNAHTAQSLHMILSKIGQADVIIPNYTNIETRTGLRRNISRLFTLIVNLTAGLNIKYYNGTTLYKTQLLKKIPRTSTGFGFQAEVLGYILKNGASYVEVDTLRRNIPDGPTTAFKLKNFINVAKGLLWLFWKFRIEKLKKVLKWLAISVLFTALLVNILNDWESVYGYLGGLSIFPLLISFFVMLIIYPEGALNFHILLKRLNSKLKFRQSFYIFIVANASRYIPGSVWQYIGRVELTKKILGQDRAKTVSVLVTEIFLLILASLITSLFFLPANKLNLWLWIILLVPLIFLYPIIFPKMLKVIASITKRNYENFNMSFGFKSTLTALSFFILNFLLNGLALFFLIGAFTNDFEVWKILEYSGFYAFSWLIGYITLFAPAGIGVTEVSLSFLLSSSMPLSLASTVAIIYRFFLTIAELLTFLIAFKLGHEKS